MASLRDVALRAGVSIATASRVASGSAPVRPPTRERVERAMRELLYVPPRRAQRTGAIGLLVPDLGNPVFPALALAMQARATEAGLAAVLCNTAGSLEREVEYVHMLLERGVDGMIFVCSEVTDERGDHGHYRRLLADGARVVFVNGAAADGFAATQVGVDERAAGFLATRHLLELGHTAVGFVAGPEHTTSTRGKAAGMRAALASAGVSDGRVTYGDFTVEGGRRALRELLRRHPDVTAVICSNDLVAIGALKEARELALRVPDELSIVGFDGIGATTWTEPPLTTLEQPVEQIAVTAVDALVTLIAEPARDLPDSVFRPRLRVRGTTGPAPARR